MTDNRLVNLTVGWTFILLGVAGAVLPVLQGFLFFVVGLLFLSKEYHWAGKTLLWLKAKIGKYFPRALKVFDDAERFLEGEVRKMATEKGYVRRKAWLIVLILAVLGLSGWVLSLLFSWLWGLVFH
jgi:uncharacterized membrane protein YbaN (DUF454 family)